MFKSWLWLTGQDRRWISAGEILSGENSRDRSKSIEKWQAKVTFQNRLWLRKSFLTSKFEVVSVLRNHFKAAFIRKLCAHSQGTAEWVFTELKSILSELYNWKTYKLDDTWLRRQNFGIRKSISNWLSTRHAKKSRSKPSLKESQWLKMQISSLKSFFF